MALDPTDHPWQDKLSGQLVVQVKCSTPPALCSFTRVCFTLEWLNNETLKPAKLLKATIATRISGVSRSHVTVASTPPPPETCLCSVTSARANGLMYMTQQHAPFDVQLESFELNEKKGGEKNQNSFVLSYKTYYILAATVRLVKVSQYKHKIHKKRPIKGVVSAYTGKMCT